MTRFSQVTAALRRKSLGQYALLTLCCFVSVLLITAYASMMGSPTVLSVFPEGGDSRKQMTMIFVLAVLGCGVFTTYASGLFFRHKSRDVGILLALGASKDQLRRVLEREGETLALSDVQALLAGRKGFLCQYDRAAGRDTVWSAACDLTRRRCLLAEGNPGRTAFREIPFPVERGDSRP